MNLSRIRGSSTLLTILILLIAVIVLMSVLEDLPQYQDKLVDQGTVVASGCVNGTYKGHVTYDCSTEILMRKEGTIRTILTFGTLPNDLIGKYCGERLNSPYRCSYRRIKND